jgi:ectoine hydroxylase-related dioxygenase (phytanoyl-CoA dioxygenase family)
MKDLLRRLKFSYSIYNFFHKRDLKHNIPLYKKYGIDKRYYSPVSSKDFQNLKLDTIIQKEVNLSKSKLYLSENEENKKSIDDFDENGFLILKNYLSIDKVDEINNQLDDLIAKGTLKFRYKNKIMFAIHQLKSLRNIGDDENLKELLSILLKGSAKLFQSINFIMGSEQKSHSDSIHMTTFPLGGLLGVWIALDDITENNGPLHYYPGSHKLPYYLNSDYENEGSYFLIGKQSYAAYENMIEKKITEQKIEKKIFTAKKGDLLIWHANLFHGGEPHKDKNSTRKSVVFHYFNDNAICYHEISQRPALMKRY